MNLTAASADAQADAPDGAYAGWNALAQDRAVLVGRHAPPDTDTALTSSGAAAVEMKPLLALG